MDQLAPPDRPGRAASITRILGLILAALAVQLVANGLQELWP